MTPSIKTLSKEIAENIVGVFFDIDDTFTSRGKILPEAFNALWSLRENGLKAVPITGRPAGWCDHIARMWPVDGVVGENGAFYFWMDDTEQKLKKRFLDPESIRAENRKRLIRVKEDILTTIPGTALASDQLYREADLAIDFCEDVPALTSQDIEKICHIFKKHGATCKVSSIHVNGWFGAYDKLKMTKIFVRERWDLDLAQNKNKFIFCGDSPNDEPMFQYFPYAVGVKNVLHFSDQLQYPPAYIASFNGGKGFAEIVDHILGLCAK